MIHELPQSSPGQYGAAHAVTARRFDCFFRTREDADGPEVSAIEDLSGDVAIDARVLAAGKVERLYRFTGEISRHTSERDTCCAASVSYHECPTLLPRQDTRRKNLTPGVPYA